MAKQRKGGGMDGQATGDHGPDGADDRKAALRDRAAEFGMLAQFLAELATLTNERDVAQLLPSRRRP